MRRNIICLYCFCFLFISCNIGRLIIYTNPNFEKTRLNEFQIDDDVYITVDIKYTGENYGLIFHVYSPKDSFKNLTVQSLRLEDENGVVLFERNFINVAIEGDDSFFDSKNNLYERVFTPQDCYLSKQKIQEKKTFYNLEYYVNGINKKEKLIRKEEVYLLTET